jgi:hypothetical protein
MDLNFYQGEKGKVIGLVTASPEEFQTYAAAFLEVPEGCALQTRVRTVKVGKTSAETRREILIGAAPVGKPLAIAGDDKHPLPAPAVPRALEIPQNVKLATDANLEVMAATNGVEVTAAWRRRSRPLREADVAKAMVERKQQPVGASNG